MLLWVVDMRAFSNDIIDIHTFTYLFIYLLVLFIVVVHCLLLLLLHRVRRAVRRGRECLRPVLQRGRVLLRR
jgi:hypothetical protein